MGKHILIINDLPGYGQVALAGMMPILAGMGHHIFNLPTALVSNTLDYGKFDILETTDYMANTMEVWGQLGFSFDAAAVGFIVSERQTKLITDYCRTLKENGTLVFVDPIMGDEGILYNSVTDKTIENMRTLISIADYIVPNYTEAAALAGVPYRAEGITESEAERLVQKLRALGAGSIVITSAVLDGRPAVISYDQKSRTTEFLPFEPLVNGAGRTRSNTNSGQAEWGCYGDSVRFHGTGDVFSASFLGNILSGNNVKESAKAAMCMVEKLIKKYRQLPEPYKGMPVEYMLGLLEHGNGGLE